MKKYLALALLCLPALLIVAATHLVVKATKPTDITPGTVVTIQPYDTNIIPPQVVNYDPTTISTATQAGSRYKVISNRVVYVGNESFTLVTLEAVYSWMPIKSIEWPAYYCKIAFGGISANEVAEAKFSYPAPGTTVYPQGFIAGQYPLCDYQEGDPGIPYSNSANWYFQACKVLYLIGPSNNPTCAYLQLLYPVVPGSYFISWPVSALVY